MGLISQGVHFTSGINYIQINYNIHCHTLDNTDMHDQTREHGK